MAASGASMPKHSLAELLMIWALVHQLAGKIIERIDQTDRLTDLHASDVCSSEAKMSANLKNDLNIITGTGRHCQGANSSTGCYGNNGRSLRKNSAVL